MEEIKSSYPGVNKLIESYNSKVYVASFLSSGNGKDDWKSVIFNTKLKALRYIINNIELIFNDLCNNKIIDNLRDDERDYFYDIEIEYFEPIIDKDEYLYYKGELYREKYVIKDINDIMERINSVTSCYGIIYYHNIKGAEIE